MIENSREEEEERKIKMIVSTQHQRAETTASGEMQKKSNRNHRGTYTHTFSSARVSSRESRRAIAFRRKLRRVIKEGGCIYIYIYIAQAEPEGLD